MAADNTPLKTAQGKMAPQVYDQTLDEWRHAQGSDGTQFVEDKNAKSELALIKQAVIDSSLKGKVVQDYYEGNGNYTMNFTAMTGISIANDGMASLTFIVNGKTRTVYAGEPYNANLPSFTSVTITATDKYRIEVLS